MRDFIRDYFVLVFFFKLALHVKQLMPKKAVGSSFISLPPRLMAPENRLFRGHAKVTFSTQIVHAQLAIRLHTMNTKDEYYFFIEQYLWLYASDQKTPLCDISIAMLAKKQSLL